MEAMSRTLHSVLQVVQCESSASYLCRRLTLRFANRGFVRSTTDWEARNLRASSSDAVAAQAIRRAVHGEARACVCACPRQSLPLKKTLRLDNLNRSLFSLSESRHQVTRKMPSGADDAAGDWPCHVSASQAFRETSQLGSPAILSRDSSKADDCCSRDSPLSVWLSSKACPGPGLGRSGLVRIVRRDQQHRPPTPLTRPSSSFVIHSPIKKKTKKKNSASVSLLGQQHSTT